jgi:hypothetical protein
MKKLIMTLAAVLLCGTAGAQENDSTVCAQQMKTQTNSIFSDVI